MNGTPDRSRCSAAGRLVRAHALAGQHEMTFYLTEIHNVPRRVLEITGLLAVLTEQAPLSTT